MIPAAALRTLRRLGALTALALALTGPSIAQQPRTPTSIEAENATLAAEIATASAAVERVQTRLADLRRRQTDLEETMQLIERRAQVSTLGDEFAQALTDQLARLPQPERFAALRDDRSRQLATAGDAILRAQRQLRRLGEADAATAGLATQGAADARAALASQRDLLRRLAEVQTRLLEALGETERFERDAERQVEEYRTRLTGYLFWMPALPGRQMVSEFAPALAWMLSPANWRAAGAASLESLVHAPLGPGLALLTAVVLVLLRKRLQHGLASLTPASVTLERYRVGHTIAAFAITFALAVPGPIVLLAAATLFGTGTSPFALALGDALERVPRLLLALSTWGWLLDARGVAVGHFGWDERSASYARRELRRFTTIFVPLMFVAVLNGLEHAPYVNRESLARLALMLAMASFAVFMVILFRRKSPLMQSRGARNPRAWAVRLHAVWFWAAVAAPLSLMALAGAGYFVAVAHFMGRLVFTLFLFLGGAMLFGLVTLWVRVRSQRLARECDASNEGTANAKAAEERAINKGEPRPPDVAAIGARTLSIFDLLIWLLLLGGIWWVWNDSVPALSGIVDHTLWTHTETVAGNEVVRQVTVGHVLLAVLLAALAGVAVRNVGALLDIVLLYRLGMRADDTYAFKVLARYSFAAIGIVLVSRLIGLGWSDVQWLVAAMSVGLGFGLQEIVANFVSGLIILAERPIRIGDVVTVGTTTGRVAGIGARATVVVDADCKEVIIPNKALITERVVNWTLSDKSTRLSLKVSVATGSDIALVQRAVLAAVQSIAEVMRAPPPAVYFVGFGDGSLDFEIQAFVDSLEKRSRVQHEIVFATSRALAECGIEDASRQFDVRIRPAPSSPAPGA